jgi:hypothetical protein
MADQQHGAEAYIENSERITDIFVAGRHFMMLTLEIDHWEMTNEADEKGFFRLRNRTRSTLEFRDVQAFRMDGFNQQNVMMELILERTECSEPRAPKFLVRIPAAWGMDATFQCLAISVLRCSLITPRVVKGGSED